MVRAFATASTLNASISRADIDVVDQPVKVEDLIALPVASAGFVPNIVLETVGKDVPVDTFQISMVVVGLVPVATIFQPVMVAAAVAIIYLVLPVVMTPPCPSQEILKGVAPPPPAGEVPLVPLVPPPEVPALPDVPVEPLVPVADVPEVPVLPDVPLEPAVPLVPPEPLVPLVPVADVPEVPVEPLVPAELLRPEVPAVPLVPVLPLVPELPEGPA